MSVSVLMVYGPQTGLKYFRTPPTMLTNGSTKASMPLKPPTTPLMSGTPLDCQAFGFLYPHMSSTEPQGLLSMMGV